jgi:hypothetical protein
MICNSPAAPWRCWRTFRDIVLTVIHNIWKNKDKNVNNLHRTVQKQINKYKKMHGKVGDIWAWTLQKNVLLLVGNY